MRWQHLLLILIPLGVLILGLVLDASASHEGVSAGLVGGGAVGVGAGVRAWLRGRKADQRR